MKVSTTRFGLVEVLEKDVINFTDGLLGFEQLKKFIIVDPSDETLILWLQSVDSADVAFPILEPKLFKGDYKVRLSANELRSLNIDSTKGKETLVYCILTIPQDIVAISANLKAPIVINAETQVARQVVLQENEYSVKFPMYKELMAVMVSTRAGSKKVAGSVEAPATALSLQSTSSKVEVIGL